MERRNLKNQAFHDSHLIKVLKSEQTGWFDQEL